MSTDGTTPDDPLGVAESDPRRQAPPIVWPLLLLLGLTAVLEWTNADLAVSGLFYDVTATARHYHDGWIHAGRFPWVLIDEVGPILGVGLGVLATIAAVVGSLRLRWFEHRYLTSFVSLCILIGPLLLVNAALKCTWGRPRPNTVNLFGGPEEHRPTWSPGSNPVEHRSFPSGHASIGFALMIPAFAFYRRRRKTYERWLLLGFLYGLVMSSSRIVQGSHFVTDVLWSAGLVYLVAAILYRCIDPEHIDPPTVAADGRQPATSIAA